MQTFLGPFFRTEDVLVYASDDPARTLRSCTDFCLLTSRDVLPSLIAHCSRDMAGKTGQKPNILFIMADDIGWFNISCNNNGIMGYRTHNIDRIA
jgi:hypothetical protein